MVSIKLDYQTHNRETICRTCGKKIAKGNMRLLLDNDNNYMREKRYFHLSCIKKKIEQFEKQVPSNKMDVY